MSGTQYRRNKDLQKPSTGCVGMLVNMYDFNASMVTTKRLTDRAHRDGPPIMPSRADSNKTDDPSADRRDYKHTTSHRKSNLSSKKSGGTPVKVLMAQEMSKEADPKQKIPSVVARLMGLDDYPPAQQIVTSSSRKNLIRSHSSNTMGALGGVRQQKAGLLNKVVPFDLNQGQMEENEFKDIYEDWKQASKAEFSKHPYEYKGCCTENQSEKRMALVREKFIEAKRLATEGNLIQSKEFQDAVEVLSSNKDLFLKFLEEPNSLFSKQVNDFNAIRVPSQTRCITVLKPSKAVELKNETMVIDQYYMGGQRGCGMNTHSHSSSFSHLQTENFFQPTRIVVLKPNTTKFHNMEAQVMPQIGYSKILNQKDFDGGFKDVIELGLDNMSKPVSHQMQESSAFHRRDESLLSSFYSNGYGGDSSSLCRSEREYTEDDGGSFSDSEIVTPISRHSWNSVNKCCSTFSASSLNRTPHSPESSVIKEAKKRLSERWALVAANRINKGETLLQKSSSTLGEMLAVPEVKKEVYDDCRIRAISRSCGGENELIPVSCLSIGRVKDRGGENSPRSLSRSKSVPISSTACGKLDFSTEGSDSQFSNSTVCKEVPKNKKGKSSFKGKFSSLFSLRSKRTNREEPVSSVMSSSDVSTKSSSALSAISNKDDLPKPVVDTNTTLEINHDKESENVILQATNIDISENASSFRKVAFSIDGSWAISDLSDKEAHGSNGNLNYKLDQTSPTSVLDAPVDCDRNEHALVLGSSKVDSGKPCVLSRASPIASVSRTLSWEDDHPKPSSLKPQDSYKALSKAVYNVQEQVACVQKLFSSPGLDKCGITFTGWHSLDSPLNPMILEEQLDLEAGEKCNVKRSNHRLLFDCANSAILEVSQKYLIACSHSQTSLGSNKGFQAGDAASRQVWSLLNDWFSVDELQASPETNNSSVVIDRAIRQQEQASVWTLSMRLEVQEISKDVSVAILKDLVNETIITW